MVVSNKTQGPRSWRPSPGPSWTRIQDWAGSKKGSMPAQWYARRDEHQSRRQASSLQVLGTWSYVLFDGFDRGWAGAQQQTVQMRLRNSLPQSCAGLPSKTPSTSRISPRSLSAKPTPHKRLILARSCNLVCRQTTWHNSPSQKCKPTHSAAGVQTCCGAGSQNAAAASNYS